MIASASIVGVMDVVSDETRGNVKTLQSDFASEGAYPIVDQGQEFVAGYTDDKTRICRVEPPVIIFGDHTKYFKYIDFPFCLGADGTKVLKPRLGTDPKYLFYALQTIEIPEAGYSRHFKYLKGGKIRLPPLAEQRRIAAILDKADALRRLRQRAIDRLNTLSQSIFLEMFGDTLKNDLGWPDTDVLGSVADVVSGITKGRKLNGAVTREVPYLAVANVQDRHLTLTPLKTIAATESEISRYRLQYGDLLLTEGGDPDKLGRGTIWEGELPECIHQNHVFRVRLHADGYLSTFVSWLIGSARGKAYFLRAAKQTTGIASINKSQLASFPLLRPPLETQQRFQQLMSQITQRITQLEHARNSAEDLFASLRQRAFAGEL